MPGSATAGDVRDAGWAAATFRARHHGPGVLVVPNVWDVPSARLAELAGFACLGTTSAGIAWSLGYPDGERIPRDEMLRVVERIARQTTLPVTADLEAGYGASPAAVAESVRLAVAAGAVGINLEDATGDPARPLHSVSQQVERVAAAREAADADGVRAVVNARTDVFWLRLGTPEERVAHAGERLRAYRRAGADVVFAPGVREASAIEALVAGVGAPLNVLAGAGVPDEGTLARLGVARLSVGSGLMRVAAAGTRRALTALARGDTGPLLSDGLTYGEMDAMLRRQTLDNLDA